MKKDIHPQYIDATITCACGNQIKTHSTVGDIKVEICSACHPFFTGKQKLIDTAGRVDKFRARMEQAQKIQEATKAKKKRVPKNPDIEKLQKALEKETVDIAPVTSDKEEK